MSEKLRTEAIEVDLFLEAIYKKYGYNFKHYAKASIKRRIMSVVNKNKLNSISELIPMLLHDESFFDSIVYDFSITVTEMFRDPQFFKSLRENVFPYLKTFPIIKIWHAGCATGEEVYSLAIMLKEEGLLDRTTIFATDFNNEALAKAKSGIFSLSTVKDYTKNYVNAGGKAFLSDYYYADYDSAIFDKSLKQRITFANHNLVTDTVFGEMHLILCRNVLIYFDRELQDRVFSLFEESLVPNGFLALGSKESLTFSSIKSKVKEIDKMYRVFQKKGRVLNV
ncbi:MAG: chemotaxis protein CheR [Candidatus Cloacimonetes bacterium 4572_65]|nr:MAG: chemotaxis protein CheR [Candidatus Cloacimonetes bacterium 4572_65]